MPLLNEFDLCSTSLTYNLDICILMKVTSPVRPNQPVSRRTVSCLFRCSSRQLSIQLLITNDCPKTAENLSLLQSRYANMATPLPSLPPPARFFLSWGHRGCALTADLIEFQMAVIDYWVKHWTWSSIFNPTWHTCWLTSTIVSNSSAWQSSVNWRNGRQTSEASDLFFSNRLTIAWIIDFYGNLEKNTSLLVVI